MEKVVELWWGSMWENLIATCKDHSKMISSIEQTPVNIILGTP